MSEESTNKDKAKVSKAMRPEIIRLGIALLGGILVLNAYIARVLLDVEY